MRRFFVTLLVGVFFVFWGTVQAQVGGSPPEEPPPADNTDDPNLAEMTINLSGAKCEINLNESELLRVKGIVMVDVESKPGKVVVGYDKTVTNKGLIKAAVGKKKGGCAAAEDVGGGTP